MAIPWDLVASGLLALGVGGLVARLMGHRVGPVLDAVLSVGLPALVAARLAVIALDVALTGSVPPPAAWLAITAGMSLPVGLLVALLFGARRLRSQSLSGQPEGAAVVAITAAWAGMAAWSAMSPVRGEVAGIAAPLPVGLPWPGEVGTVVLTGLLEAVALAGLLLWARRRHAGDPARLGAWFVVALAATHLVGGALRPSLPTVDADLDVLLGLAALVAAVVAVRRPSAAALRGGVAVGGLVIGGLLGGIVLDARVPVEEGTIFGPSDPSLADALIPGGDHAAAPAWDAADLRTFVANAGRPVVVNLWASWCPPCHAEAPALSRAVRALGDDVVVLGLLTDDTAEDGQAFVDRYSLPFPTVVDAGAAASLGFVGLPTTVVLAPDGTVADRAVGGVSPGWLASALRPLAPDAG